MRKSLLNVLRAPACRELLTLCVFESKESSREDVVDGILICNRCGKAYPITNGVPVMLDSGFTQEFLRKYSEKISRDGTLSKLHLSSRGDADWSFSTEWDVHFRSNLVRTWGWTVEERVEQFFRETETDASWCEGKVILDAGCGNGQLSEGLAELGATVIALDYSTSVVYAETQRKSLNVHFVRADLQAPPFDIDTFDLIISNGVLHHTPDTYTTFMEVAKLVKPGGRFYLWLYRRPEKLARRCFLYPTIDLTRMLVSRSPRHVQALMVRAFALALKLLHRMLGKAKELSWDERVVGAYDVLAPLWRHYHSPIEVSYWFFQNGYSPPTLTHWDTPYGFGMVATKVPQEKTPGVNFGEAGIFRRGGVLRRHWQ